MPGRPRREDSRYAAASSRLSQQLRLARAGKKMTQQRLAGLAEVSIGTVRSIESQTVVEPGLFTVMALARALEYDIAAFIVSENPRV